MVLGVTGRDVTVVGRRIEGDVGQALDRHVLHGGKGRREDEPAHGSTSVNL